MPTITATRDQLWEALTNAQVTRAERAAAGQDVSGIDLFVDRLLDTYLASIRGL